jgi:hypothetical protein
LDQASAVYERAVSGILSKSMLLHFAYADFEEQLNKNEKVHQIYTKYLELEDIDPTLVSNPKTLVMNSNNKTFFAVVLHPVHEVHPADGRHGRCARHLQEG